MKSIVIDLQQDALNNNISVTDLLRKAYVVSKKLKISDFEEWISSELDGYVDNEKIPKYREFKGTVMALNPYHGWQPIFFEDTKTKELLSKKNNGQRIAEIENLLNKITDPTQSIHAPFTAEQENIICNAIGERLQITLKVAISDLVRIVDAVRNIVLNWSLQLEEDGILGENMTFTKNEKDKVVEHSYNVNNFYGCVTDSQIQQGSIDSMQTQKINNFSTKEVDDFILFLKENLKDIKLNTNKKEELKAEIATVEAQIKSPKPKVSIIREGFISIRNILEGAGGSATFELLAELGKFFL